MNATLASHYRKSTFGHCTRATSGHRFFSVVCLMFSKKI
ncbi:unnamed protein product [Debaryomyces tyrocola]|nr:unnamed protein product [Debaryomyces tyrocola]